MNMRGQWFSWTKKYLFFGSIGSLFVLYFILPLDQSEYQKIVVKYLQSALPPPTRYKVMISLTRATVTTSNTHRMTGRTWVILISSFRSTQPTHLTDDEQVIIMGSHMPLNVFKKVKCIFYQHPENDSRYGISEVKKSRATVEKMKADSVLAGTFIRCPLPKKDGLAFPATKPVFVSVLLGNQSEIGARLPIKYQSLNVANRPFQFAVCVRPMFDYNQVFHFIEWLEYYKMMGVRHFTFFNRSIGSATSCVMDHYKNSLDGVTVKVNPWSKFPFQKNTTYFTLGEESPAINDCWYSHRGLSKYMVYVDVDEFIVLSPGSPNFEHLIKYIEKRSPPLGKGNKVGESWLEETSTSARTICRLRNVCAAENMNSIESFYAGNYENVGSQAHSYHVK